MFPEKSKILIVDDEKSNLRLLSELIGNEADIMLAKSGQQALEKANKAQPDVILLDVVMPDMDGFEVLLKLKNNPATRLIPVIFITGLTDVKFEEKGLALGASDYIIKPIHEQLVKARIKLHLQLVKQRSLLEKVALVDPLTDLPNRKKYEEVANLEWRAAVRHSSWFSIALFNVDGFKSFNEKFGYAAGDEALSKIAVALSSQLQRSRDFIARFSGQEFVILLPGSDPEGAIKPIEKCKSALASLQIPSALAQSDYLTASVAGASIIPGMSDSIDTLLFAVAKQLSTMQQQRLNQVSWQQPG